MKRFLFCIFILCMSIQTLHAEIPKLINYSGKLTDKLGHVVADITSSVKFELFTAASGGTAVWSETQSVQTRNGAFNILLGSVTPLNLEFSQNYWIAFTYQSETFPRQQIVSVPYALRAENANAAISAQSTTTAVYAIAAGTAVNSTFSQNAIYAVSAQSATTAAYADTAGSATNVTALNTNAVTTSTITNSAVTELKLADDSVTSAKIKDGEVKTVDIMDGAVTTNKIGDTSITNGKLATNAVATVNIQDSAVTLAKLSSGAVTTDKILDKAITATKIANSTITNNQMAPDSIGWVEIMDNAVRDYHIQNGAVTTNKIADSSITRTKIASGEVLGGNIGSNTITASNIANETITSNKIKDGTIATADLADNVITSGKIANGTILTEDIADGAVTKAKLSADLIAQLLPIGTIIAWHRDITVPGQSLPAGFLICNGQPVSDNTSPLNGLTLPNLNGEGRFLRGNSTSGINQSDTLQGHWHKVFFDRNGSAGSYNTIFSDAEAVPYMDNGTVSQYSARINANGQEIIQDSMNGTPRISSETKPINMSVVWIIKVK